MERLISPVLAAAITSLAACSPSGAKTASPEDAQASTELFSALPAGLAELIARDAAQYWAMCDDIWVTQNAGRSAQGHPHAFVMAGGPQLHHTGSFGDAGDPDPVRIHVSSAMYRVYQTSDLPVRQPARVPGWSEWVALTAPELPVWSARQAGDGWTVTFRPEADPADNDRYARQYTAPDCGLIPEG